MTIPNCISLFRIFLVPCFAWVFLTASLPEDFTLAAVLLVVFRTCWTAGSPGGST